MSKVELRHIIMEHLSQIEDPSFLNAIKTIIESKISGGIHKLSEFQIDRVNSARNDLNNGQTISHDQLQNEINQWLVEK